MQKYLCQKLMLAGNEAFRLTKKNQIGRILYHLLRTPQVDRQYAEQVGEYPACFHVTVSSTMSWLNGCRHLTEQGIHDFNRQVEDMIEEEFINRLEAVLAVVPGMQVKAFTLHFMALYGFTDEDFTPDALIKAHYRRRKARPYEKPVTKVIFPIPNCPPVLVGATIAGRA